MTVKKGLNKESIMNSPLLLSIAPPGAGHVAPSVPALVVHFRSESSGGSVVTPPGSSDRPLHAPYRSREGSVSIAACDSRAVPQQRIPGCIFHNCRVFNVACGERKHLFGTFLSLWMPLFPVTLQHCNVLISLLGGN